MRALGEYGYKFASAKLLEPLSGNADPVIAKMNKKRLSFCEEPEESAKLNGSCIKDLTGAGELCARACHSNDVSQKLTHSLFMLCNKIPLLDTADDATKRRLRVIPFQSKFLNEEDYAKVAGDEETKRAKGIFRMNTKFENDDFADSMRCAMLKILFQSFRTFRDNGFQLPNQPDQVRTATEAHHNASDEIFKWFCDTYEQTPMSLLKHGDDIELRIKAALYDDFITDNTGIVDAKGKPYKKNAFADCFRKRRHDDVLQGRYFEKDEACTLQGQRKFIKAPTLFGFKRIASE